MKTLNSFSMDVTLVEKIVTKLKDLYEILIRKPDKNKIDRYQYK